MASVRVTCPKCGSLLGVYGNTRVLTGCTSCKTRYTLEIRNGLVSELK
jgi:ribosomal protein S27E